MTVRTISLSKLLKLFYAPNQTRRKILREGLRADARRSEGDTSGGGDFYVSFWSDAKNHVLNNADLRAATELRIQASAQRRNLYPLLADGFLVWWDERRRWTNAPYIEAQHISARTEFPSLEATVKTESLMSVRDGRNEDHHVYPYFAMDPVLGEEAARLGLWVLDQAFPETPTEQLRILDVFRGASFAVDRSPFQGNEQDLFESRYRSLISEEEQQALDMEL